MFDHLYEAAAAGDLNPLLMLGAAIEADPDFEDPECHVYQWLQVAACLGVDDAADYANGLYEASLSGSGDETVASLHMEVAQWFVHGTYGVVVNHDHAIAQLSRAQDFGLWGSLDGLDEPLLEIRAKIGGVHHLRFDALFPELVFSTNPTVISD
jgi:hypothetical protein